MLDGDVFQTGEKPDDGQGQIRVQPRTAHGTQHRGIVVQLKRLPHQPKDAFSYFAQDLRQQWLDAKECPELLTKKH